MKETNSKHTIDMTIGTYKLYIKEYKILGSAKTAEINMIFNSYLHSSSFNVVIEGISFGNCIMTDYEICGCEDDYVYKVSLTLCKVQ